MDNFNKKGNVNLNNRPVIKNKDKSISTSSSASYGLDGEEVLLPTIINGKRATDDEVIAHYRKTGKHLGKFKTPQEATAHAKKLSKRQGDNYINKKRVKKASKKIPHAKPSSPSIRFAELVMPIIQRTTKKKGKIFNIIPSPLFSK